LSSVDTVRKVYKVIYFLSIVTVSWWNTKSSPFRYLHWCVNPSSCW